MLGVLSNTFLEMDLELGGTTPPPPLPIFGESANLIPEKGPKKEFRINFFVAEFFVVAYSVPEKTVKPYTSTFVSSFNKRYTLLHSGY